VAYVVFGINVVPMLAPTVGAPLLAIWDQPRPRREPEGFPLMEWCVKQTCTLQSSAPTLLKRYGLDVSEECGKTLWRQSHSVADHASCGTSFTPAPLVILCTLLPV
jgi:hypothetical protein